jgi:hypothetical protein
MDERRLFRSFVPKAVGRGDDFVAHESKSVPQRLKPSSAQTITARLNPCPSFDSLFPSLSGAVQVGQPKNVIWTVWLNLAHQDAVPQALTYLGCFSSNLPQNRHPERSASQIYRVVQRWARSRRTPKVLILSMLFGAFRLPKPEN